MVVVWVKLIVWQDKDLNLGPWGVDFLATFNVNNVSGLLDWISTGPMWD